ncbi:hypothetical protein [Gilliamella sp. CG16]|uniref:hypothetical protein n=1 Tax=Gilliamella sp. CG16 TaxID=3351503 RepID=UPI003985B15F
MNKCKRFRIFSDLVIGLLILLGSIFAFAKTMTNLIMLRSIDDELNTTEKLNSGIYHSGFTLQKLFLASLGFYKDTNYPIKNVGSHNEIYQQPNLDNHRQLETLFFSHSHFVTALFEKTVTVIKELLSIDNKYSVISAAQYGLFKNSINAASFQILGQCVVQDSNLLTNLFQRKDRAYKKYT